MTTLINTLISEQGELFALFHGQRKVLAHCRPEIRIYEKATKVPALGKHGHMEKSIRFTVALCGDMDFTFDIGGGGLAKVERYELTADILRSDGIAERFFFHNISLVEINTEGVWEFDLEVTKEQMDKLLAIAGV